MARILITALVAALLFSAPASAQESPEAVEAYGKLLNAHIAKFNKYPEEAVDKEIEGTPIVYFTIDQQGKLLSREIAQSSGHKILDDAALKAVEKASPFPLPQGTFPGTTRAEFTLPIVYMQ